MIRSSIAQPPNQPAAAWTRKRLRLLGSAALFLALAASALPSQYGAQARAAGDVLTPQRPVSPGGTVLGPSDPQRSVSLSVSLKVNDRAALESFIQQLSDPTSPQYKHFLTPAEFTSRFVSSSARSQVDAFLTSQGLTVNDSGLGTIVNAAGSVAQAQNAFHVQISDYRLADGHTYYANNLTPALPVAVAGLIESVSGLDNFPRAHPMFVRPTLPKVKPQIIANAGTPTGCAAATSAITTWGQGLTPNEFNTAYNFTGVGNTGAGQTVALFELDNYTDSNAASYQSCFGTAVPLTRVNVDGGVPTPGSGQGEVELDLDTIVGLAPAITSLRVYIAPNSGTGLIDEYQRIANDNLAKVISSSWGLCERLDGSASATTEDNIFAQFVTQGQDVFQAAGDSGSAGCQRSDSSTAISVEADAAGPHATGVGGTFLSLNTNNTIASEPAWNRFGTTSGATGGGVSTFFARPAYQTGTGTTRYSTTMRQVPDVGAAADPNNGYLTFTLDPTNCPFVNGANNCFEPIGGTSAATPLWAAGTAILNEFLALHGKPILGFANPQLYQVFNSSSYATAFHDIATGSNCYVAASPPTATDCGTPGSSTGLYQTSAGYDPVTGIGTPNFGGLAQALLGAATTSTVTSSLNPSTVGQSVTFTAHVTSASGTPTGTVTFKDGATTLGTGTLAAGTTTFATTTLAAGTHSITAAYGGAAGFAASTSAALSQVVNTAAAATTSTVTSSLNPSTVGQSVTFTAHVTSASGTPTGTVTFKDGATTLGTGTLAAGTTTFATTTLAAGTHSITVAYGGAAGFAASTSAALSQVVNTAAAATTSTVTSSLNPSTVGQSVTFTAHVTSASGTPTGTVTFKDGATTLGTGTLAAGTTTFATTTLAAGTHSITAAYAGAAGFAASTSAALSQVVNAAAVGPIVVHGLTIKPVHAVAFTGNVGSLTDTKAGMVAANYTATIDWGDGTATSLGTVTGSAGTFTIAGTHTYAAAGFFSVNVTIGVNDGRSAYLASIAQAS